MTETQPPTVVLLAGDAYQAIRGMNHLNLGSTPAPLVYDVLGELKNVGHQLPQILNTLASSLEESLDEYDVYDGDGKNPEASVIEAGKHMTRAAQLAAQLGVELESAQSAINQQGYRSAKG